jgi:hypothetical protein
MVVTLRITALLGFEKDHSFSETGFVLVLRCISGETRPRRRGPTTEIGAMEKRNISCFCRELNLRP